MLLITMAKKHSAVKSSNKKSTKDESAVRHEQEAHSDDEETGLVKNDTSAEGITSFVGDQSDELVSSSEEESDMDGENVESSTEEDESDHGEQDRKDSDNHEDVPQKRQSKEQNSNDEQISEEHTSVLSTSTFESLGVIPQICEACTLANWATATQIQQEAIPHALAGRDIIGLAETGSGKTGAFAIPILQALLERPSKLFALILAPTRELAFQIYEVFQALGSASIGATCVCVVGGVDIASQAIALARQPHIIVATPGRLVDHLEHTKGFHLKNVKYLVMDEADRMLSLDFEEEINKILQVIPDSEAGRRTMLFSATMTSKVHKLQRASLSDPVRVQVSTKFSTPSQLLQYYMFIPAKYKDCYLTYLINEFAGQTILVFGATCNNVQRLALMLRNLNFKAICLHGQMTQPKRLGALHKFKSGARDILICTDVASRGLDIPDVDVVINFDLPGHGKDYIHRVGRTARAGKSGKAIAMVTQYDVEVYQRLEGLLGKQLPKFEADEETVLILLERVSEAQRLATRELKEQLASVGNKNKGGRKRVIDEQGGEGGVEEIMRDELRRKGFRPGGGNKDRPNGGRGGRGMQKQKGGRGGTIGRDKQRGGNKNFF